MKRMFFKLRMAPVYAGLVLAMGILLVACSKSNDGDAVDIPAAGLLSFNLAADKPGVSITLSGNLLTRNPLGYGNYSGYYQPIFPGTREIKSYDYYADSVISSSGFNFSTDNYYSLFVLGANGNYQHVVALDELDSLPFENGKAYIRYINAIPDPTSPLVSITASGKNVFNENSSFKKVSTYSRVDAGDVVVKADNNALINTERTISVEQGKIYTILLTGIPGSTDAAKAVQVRYILNGSIRNEN